MQRATTTTLLAFLKRSTSYTSMRAHTPAVTDKSTKEKVWHLCKQGLTRKQINLENVFIVASQDIGKEIVH